MITKQAMRTHGYARIYFCHEAGYFLAALSKYRAQVDPRASGWDLARHVYSMTMTMGRGGTFDIAGPVLVMDEAEAKRMGEESLTASAREAFVVLWPVVTRFDEVLAGENYRQPPTPTDQ